MKAKGFGLKIALGREFNAVFCNVFTALQNDCLAQINSCRSTKMLHTSTTPCYIVHCKHTGYPSTPLEALSLALPISLHPIYKKYSPLPPLPAGTARL